MQRPKNEPLKSSHPRCVSVGLRLFPTAGVFHHCGALALRARPAQRFVFGTPSGGGITAVSHGAPVPTHHVLRTWHCISALLAHPWLSAAGCNRTIGRARVPLLATRPATAPASLTPVLGCVRRFRCGSVQSGRPLALSPLACRQGRLIGPHIFCRAPNPMGASWLLRDPLSRAYRPQEIQARRLRQGGASDSFPLANARGLRDDNVGSCWAGIVTERLCMSDAYKSVVIICMKRITLVLEQLGHIPPPEPITTCRWPQDGRAAVIGGGQVCKRDFFLLGCQTIP